MTSYDRRKKYCFISVSFLFSIIPSIISSSFSRQSTLKRNSEYRKDEEGYEYEYEYEYEEVLEFNDDNDDIDDGYEVGRRKSIGYQDDDRRSTRSSRPSNAATKKPIDVSSWFDDDDNNDDDNDNDNDDEDNDGANKDNTKRRCPSPIIDLMDKIFQVDPV